MGQTASQNVKKSSVGFGGQVKITINGKWCKKCGICVAFCPKGIFESDDFGMPIVKYPERCIKCMLCVIRCPDFAIDVDNGG